MAQNTQEARKPAKSQLLILRVARSEQISPSIGRVTLTGEDIDHFVPMGFDQWFRLCIPVPGGAETLQRLPNKLDTVSYLRYLTISKSTRPALRNYTVRGFRPDGPDGSELDIDLVLHGSADDGTAGPASIWAQSCKPGDPVAIIDEGIMYAPRPETEGRVFLVGDETGLPAIAGILGSLPDTTVGRALIEIPTAGDRQPVTGPPGVSVEWIVRNPGAHPGQAALAAAREWAVPAEPGYGWVAGEHGLPTGLRRHWVAEGVPKKDITFCGYWRSGRSY